MKNRMKRLVLVLLVLSLLMPAFSFAEDQLDLPEMTQDTSTRYSNTYLGYAMNIPFYLTDLGDEYCAQYTREVNEGSTREDDDYIYDMHLWATYVSDDSLMVFEVQLKKSTYASFEEEVEKAPLYAQISNSANEAAGLDMHITQLHNGILRDTPMGKMLQTAYISARNSADEALRETITVYYDFYFNTIEYCFVLEAPMAYLTYDSLQRLLDQIMQTIHIDSIMEQA